MNDHRAALLKELQDSKASLPLITSIGAALGGSHEPTSWAPVGGHYIRYGDPYTLWCFTPDAFVFFEQTSDGRNLTTVAPLARLARVTETIDGDNVRVVVELDSDVTRFEVVAGSASAVDQSDNAPEGARAGRTEAQGRLLRGGYVLVEPVAQAARLHTFATALRQHLLTR